MRSLLASLLIPALLTASAAGSLLHTHHYEGHDHPEHHHGLAAHTHHPPPTRPDDVTARLDECDPGEHTVHFAPVPVAVPQIAVVFADLDFPEMPLPDLRRWRAVGYADVRVHGPPSRTGAPPRAPPPIDHA